MLASEARQSGIADRKLRRANWTGNIVYTPTPVPNRGIGLVVDRPRRNFRVILRGPMRGKKVALFNAPRFVGATGPLDKNPLYRVERTNRARRFVAQAFNERMTKLADRLWELRREFNAL